MKNKKKSFLTILAGLALLFFGYSQLTKLDKPIISKSYEEYEFKITNKEDLKKYSEVPFMAWFVYDTLNKNYIKSVESLDSRISVKNNISNKRGYMPITGRYIGNCIFLSFKFEEVPKEDFTINKLKVNYTNGESTEEDIGEIHFINTNGYENVFEKSEKDVSEINDHNKFDDFEYANNKFLREKSDVVIAKEDIEIISVEDSLFDKFKGDFDLKLDGINFKNLAGYKLSAGDREVVDFKMKLSKDKYPFIGQIEILPTIIYKNSSGEVKKSILGGYNFYNESMGPNRAREIVKSFKENKAEDV